MIILRPVRLLLVCVCLFPILARGQSISSFTPAYGLPGASVVINGTFPEGTLIVRFNGVRDFSALQTSFSQIQAKVPTGATTGPITVQINGGTEVSSLNDFIVLGEGPFISTFSPTNGSAGTQVLIQGRNFSAATGAYFNGKAGVNFSPSETSIRVDAPTGVTTGPISVRSPYGTNVSSQLFYVPPVVTGFTPYFGRTGTNFTIRGQNFLGTTSVTLNGSNVSFTVLSNSAISVTVPPLATTGKIRVFTPVYSSSATTSNFVIRPTIYSFSPQGGPKGSSVVINGANLNVGTPAISFNGANAAYSGLSFGGVTAKVPTAATTGPISITTPHGTHVSEDIFYVSPTISAIAPALGGPGTRVKITGQNFTGATNVSFGGVSALDFAITNNTTIGVTVPVGVTTGPVTVSTPGGTATSASIFYGPPQITHFTPTHGLPGTNVTVFGINLLGATAVRFNNLEGVGLIATNNNFLTVRVPANAQAGPITVVTPGGTNVSAGIFTLDYVDLAVKIGVSPDYLFTGSNFTYSITVSNKGPAEAPNVVLTNTFLAGIRLLSAQTSQGTVRTNPLPILADFGLIPANGVAQLDLGGVYHGTGTVEMIAGAYSGYLELLPSDNTAYSSNIVYPPAVLSIGRLTNHVQITWPLMLSNFTVQFTSGLHETNTWLNLFKGRTNTAAANILVDTNNGATRFYRLKSP